jgi:hypothetical protein
MDLRVRGCVYGWGGHAKDISTCGFCIVRLYLLVAFLLEFDMLGNLINIYECYSWTLKTRIDGSKVMYMSLLTYGDDIPVIKP